MANVSSFSGAMPVIPGGEVALAEVTRSTNYTISATAVGSAANAFSTDLTFIADGISTYVIEAGWMSWNAGSTSYNVYAALWDGSAAVTTLGVSVGSTRNGPNFFTYKVTPTSGSKSYNLRFTKETGGADGLVEVQSSTSGAPANGSFYLRVSKIVNQNDGLKPFWTPPVVTQLPSQATEGDQVLLYSSSPYAGYQTHQYVTGSWRTLDDSRGTGAWESYTPTVSQGTSTNISKTVTYAKYIQFGKTVMANIRLALTGTGTTGSAIAVSLPVTAKDSSYGAIGTAQYLDASPFAVYVGYPYVLSTTTVAMQVSAATGDNLLGTSSGPQLAVASGDAINMHLVYEAA